MIWYNACLFWKCSGIHSIWRQHVVFYEPTKWKKIHIRFADSIDFVYCKSHSKRKLRRIFPMSLPCIQCEVKSDVCIFPLKRKTFSTYSRQIAFHVWKISAILFIEGDIGIAKNIIPFIFTLPCGSLNTRFKILRFPNVILLMQSL